MMQIFAKKKNTATGSVELKETSDLNEHILNIITCMIIRKLIITRFLSFNIVVQYNSDTMDF